MKKIIATILLSTLVLSSCGTDAVTSTDTPEIAKKSVKIESVKNDYFTEDVKFIGKIAAEKETVISSQTSGVIKSINASVGKRVANSEKLAVIDYSSTSLGVSLDNATTAYSNALTTYGLTKESIEKDLENARISLENARTSKENTYVSTEKQLQLAQTQLDNILTQRSNTEKTTKLSVELARKSKENAELNLANFEKNSIETTKTLADKKSGLYKTMRSTIESSLVSIDSSLTQADLILGVTEKNRNANDAYEAYLGVKDTQAKTAAENLLTAARSGYDALVKSKNFASPQDTENAFQRTRALLDGTIALYDKLVSVLDNSIVSSAFPQTSSTLVSLDGLKATVSAKQSALLSSLQPTFVSLGNSLDDINNSISSTETTITTTRASLQTALDIATSNLASAEAGTTSSIDSITGNETLTRSQLENTIASVKSSRDSVDNAVRTAEAQYDSTRAKLQSSLASVKTQTDASKSQKSIAGIQFDNGLIKAPFSGIILSKSIEVGTLVSPGTQIFTIGDDSSLLVRLDVNPDVIKSLSIGQSVFVQKSGKTFTGAISLLSPGAATDSKMFRVEARIADSHGFSQIGNIGDLVDVHLLRKREGQKSVIVPFSALMSGSQGEFNVYVVSSDSTVKLRSVKIGLQNAQNVEILSWLSEGERIVTEGALSIQEGDTVEEKK